MKKYNWSDKEAFAKLVTSSSTKSEMLRQIGLTCTMGNYQTIDRWSKLHSVSIDHFTPKSNRVANRARTRSERGDYWTVDTALVAKSVTPRKIVKRLILEHGLIDYKCRDCEIESDWNGKPITLQLEHINGVNDDHRLENLCFLCPNCHSQTATYAGRNKRVVIHPQSNAETKRAKERARVEDTSSRIRALLEAVPSEAFNGWGAKKAVAAIVGIPQGKLMYYIRQYAPEFESKFIK